MDALFTATAKSLRCYSRDTAGCSTAYLLTRIEELTRHDEIEHAIGYRIGRAAYAMQRASTTGRLCTPVDLWLKSLTFGALVDFVTEVAEQHPADDLDAMSRYANSLVNQISATEERGQFGQLRAIHYKRDKRVKRTSD